LPRGSARNRVGSQAKLLISRLSVRDEGGQVLVLVAAGMVAICAMAGFAIDVGSWYQMHRKQQAIADASALAAAGDLPVNTTQASSDAQAYAAKNGGSASSIAFSSTYLSSDTVTIQSQQVAPTAFLKVLGINSTTVKATAIARAENLSAAWGSAPFAVINTQPELAGPGCPCFSVSTTLTLDKVGPGGFQIINVDGSKGGSGQSILADWILDGCDCQTSAPVWLYSDSGAKFNGSQVKSAMDARIASDLLFPVYDSTQGGGSNLQYHIIGFAGFHVSGYQFKGNGGEIDGWFVHVDWQGTGTSSTSTYFGATTSQLVG
jgi:Flp pilus assembly protein TadG